METNFNAPKAPPQRYSLTKRRLRWPLLVMVAAFHLLVLYGIARVFAPEMTQSVEREVIAAFDVTPAEPGPPPPENRPEPDQGAEGDPGADAVPDAVSAPPAVLETLQNTPLSQAASTGNSNAAGAQRAGEGTGAAGQGLGTGSGLGGSGRGGVAVTRPEHISGQINNARDYAIPNAGREVRRGTEVIVRVLVGVDGRARNCSIYRPSPDPEADARTCELVESRLGFRPARHAQGNPVEAPFYWRQRWF